MLVYNVAKKVRISAGHHIPNHPGKCKNPHGHNYVVEVEAHCLDRDFNRETGMVKDFYEISKDLKEIVEYYDHKDLNEEFAPIKMLTTAENLAAFWLNELKLIDERYWRVTVWETDDSSASATNITAFH